MKFILYTVLVFLVIILQVSFLSHFELLHATPNLLLVCIISWLVLKNYKASLFFAILGGSMADLFSNSFFGINMISLLIILILIYYLIHNFINSDDIYSRLGLLSFSTIVYELLIFLLSFLAGIFKVTEFSKFPMADLIFIFLGGIILNSVLMILLYKFIKGLHNFILHQEEKIKAKT